MIFIVSLGIATLFAAGSYLLLKPDFVKVIAGIVLISNAANFFIMSSGLSRGREPIYPFEDATSISDPLVQAMTLTAIVIGFGVTALMISLVYRVYQTHQSVDIETILDFEERTLDEEESVPIDERIPALEDRELTETEPVEPPLGVS
jgi:multicomponent Na+:H+ antiporter subunit C